MNEEFGERGYVPEGNLIIFDAPQRHGKTMAMVAFALDAYQNGRTVFSNIQLGFPHQPLEFDELELETGGAKFWNGHIAIDELNFYYDARRSLSGANIKFGTFLLQQKKQGCNLTGTTHDLFSLDLRLRQAFDFLIEPKVFPAFPETPQVLRLEISNGPMQAEFSRTVTFDCRFLMGLYDSFAVYNPFDEVGGGRGKNRGGGADKPRKRISLEDL